MEKEGREGERTRRIFEQGRKGVRKERKEGRKRRRKKEMEGRWGA